MEDIQKNLQKLVEMEIIFPGEYVQTKGITTFKPLTIEEFENKINSNNIQNLAYYTKSMGRGIFSIGADGKFVNFKGVDSQLQNNQLVNNTATKSYNISSTNDYNLAFIYFGYDKGFDIRVTGASAIKNLEKEIKKLYELKSTGSDLLKLPDITNIIELDNEFCRNHGIPMIISITNDEKEEFNEKQQAMLDIESDAREAIGEENFRVNSNTRGEKWREFFSRVAEEQGITYEEYLENIAKKLSEKIDLPVSMQELEKGINYLDDKYALGQKFGQATRIVENPFRITDLQAEIIKTMNISEQSNEQKQIGQKKLKEMILFSSKCLGLKNGQEYLLKYAEIMGKNVAGLLNEEWMYNNWAHRQDFSLSGELCDDAFEKVSFYEETGLSENQGNVSDKHKQEMTQQKKKYFNQIYLFASNMKIIEDAYKIAGLEIPSNYRETFIDNIFGNLTMDKKIKLVERVKSTKNMDILSDIYEINPKYIRIMDKETGKKIVDIDIQNSESVYKNFEGYEEYINSFHALLIGKIQGDTTQADTMKPIAKEFLESAKRISENEKARNITSGQQELRVNYIEYDNPNVNLDNKSLEE